MDFSFSSDQQILKASARAFLDEHMKPAQVRALADDPRGESEAVWKDIAQLGWLGLSLPEQHGGAGLGMVETAILLEEMGRAAFPAPYWPTILAATAFTEAGTSAQQARWLPAIANGTARAAIAFLDDDLSWDLAAATTTRAEPAGKGRWRLVGTKRFVPWAHVADVLLIPARAADGLSLFVVKPASAGLTMSPVPLMDLSGRWATVTLDRVIADEAVGAPGQAGPLLTSLVLRGAVGAAAEMLGAARRCLDMAVGYAKVREQFGQPIGSFQAIRHKCAEMLLEVENMHSATYYAAWAIDANAEDRAVAVSVAKAYAGDASRKVCGEAIQVHGGIGFTWEYDLHIYFKRAKALETMYGDSEYHRERLVRQVAGE